MAFFDYKITLRLETKTIQQITKIITENKEKEKYIYETPKNTQHFIRIAIQEKIRREKQ